MNAERILGKGELGTIFGSYGYKGSRVRVRYKRADKNPGKDIVEQIHVCPNNRLLLAEYAKSIPNFRKEYLKTALDNDLTLFNRLAVY